MQSPGGSHEALPVFGRGVSPADEQVAAVASALLAQLQQSHEHCRLVL